MTSQENREAKSRQMDNMAELLMRISELPVHHITLNPLVETPYDCYMSFIDKVKESLRYEEILALDRERRNEVNVEQIITPQYAMSLAYNALTSIMEESSKPKT